VETTQTCVFLHVCIHLKLAAKSPQHLKDLLHTGSKSYIPDSPGIPSTSSQDVEDLCISIGFAIFPTVVKCQHKQCRRFMPSCRRFAPQNWLLWQRPLTEVHQICSHGNFSSTVLTQQYALRSVHPLSNERGDSLK